MDEPTLNGSEAPETAREEGDAATRLLQSVVDALAAAVYVKDLDGRYLLVNRCCRDLLRIAKDAVGKSDHELFPRERAEQLRALDRKVLAAGRPLESEESVPRDDGVHTYATVRAPLLDENGAASAVCGIATDVTERKRVEQALRESEAKYRSIYNNTPVMMHSIDANGRLVSVSDFWLDSLGYERGEVLGRPSVEFLTAESAEYARQVVLPAFFRTGACREVSYQFVKKNGEVMDVLLSAIAERDAGGHVARSLAVLVDVTERKRAEQALRRSEERYRALYEDNPSMYFTVEPGGRVLSVNSFGAAELGYTPSELVGESVLSVFYHPDRAAAAAHLAACLAQPGRVFHWELRKTRKDGSLLWVKESARAVGSNGDLVVLVVCEDISDRKRAEGEQIRLQAALQGSAGEWRLTFDAIEVPIVIVDLTGRITRLNQAAAQVARRPINELLGLPLDRVASGQPWQKAAELLAFVRGSHTGTTCQVKDEAAGQTWDVGATLVAAPVRADNRIIVMARDITSLVQLQDSLRRNETMAAMGSLVAGVAHEVRNPLFGMSATLDAFEARHQMEPRTEPYLSVLRGELNRLSGLMRELLEYGKPPALDLVAGPIEPVIAEAVQSCAAHAELRGVRVLSLIADELPFVEMDHGRLVQVFTNLLQNAIEHSPRDGVVTVAAQPTQWRDEAAVEGTVTDEGSGIVPEDLSQVFEPFFSRRRGGTGLGLSIVHRIVEQHGGRVEASNSPQGGAVMRVKLPESVRSR